jgi:hypothetical protein
MLSNILITRWNPRTQKIIVDYHCGFRRNRSTTDHILCTHQPPIVWLTEGDAAKVKNARSYTSNSAYVIMTWCLIHHADNILTGALSTSPLVVTFLDQVLWMIHKNRQLGCSLEYLIRKSHEWLSGKGVGSGHAAMNANRLLSKAVGICRNYRVLPPPSLKGVFIFHIKWWNGP